MIRRKRRFSARLVSRRIVPKRRISWSGDSHRAAVWRSGRSSWRYDSTAHLKQRSQGRTFNRTWLFGGELLLCICWSFWVEADFGVLVKRTGYHPLHGRSTHSCYGNWPIIEKRQRRGERSRDFGLPSNVFFSLAVGITNPAAILTFLLAFSWFGIPGETGLIEEILLVGGVFLSTFIWWGILTAGTEALRKRAKQIDLIKLNKVFGALLSILGIVVLAGFLLGITA